MIKKLVILGDSFTQKGFTPGGYCAELTNFYQRRLRVEAWGLSGYTSRHVLRYFPELHINPQETELLIVFLGANDCQVGPNGFLTSPDEFRSNITALLDTFPTSKKIVISPPISTKLISYERVQKPFVDEIYKIANARDDTVAIHFYEESQTHPTPELLFCDGLHLTAMGNSLLFRLIVECIQRNYPELLPKNIPLFLPYFEDIVLT
ncbi:isoamyl acetate hydrolytic enzyme Iah1 [Schizosaccharomyces japonicus yFS275]|uniref:Isoamyl acetate hydrolytic enzyme Iah1 n=1 Tax=Schizosaccharomyces japonicus (strain yFS275 / FY16936) TaxID=402676 RepID=B6JZF1_SCHJY|nr:isoamyl acetate hydrolytic enzyme Iah1 [Schizosaccharomyces japonicus yFS275]EEB06919.1 isoamyl acetate hydrolytic enzyme Iah1 [Schizosaccharomyces japonicus yFS275]